LVFNQSDEYRAAEDSLSGIQFNGGRDMTDHLSLEALVGYSDLTGRCQPGDCYPDQKLLDVGAHVLAFLNRDAALAPYALAGVGYLGVSSDSGPQFARVAGDGGGTMSAGLGVKWRLRQGSFSLRLEHRVRMVFDTENLTDNMTLLGVQYDIGRKPPVRAVPAEDFHYVAEKDSDFDRVSDSRDECPDTPPGVPVNRQGCALDSDMDGVTTDKDRCPGTRRGAEVDEYGCAYDDDKDGVPDHRDSCLGTRLGARTDVKGCEIKDIISLPGVNFETGQDVLIVGTEYLLKDAADTLNRHQDLQIEVAGHSDNVGDAQANEGLSERRAKTVREFLIRYGVDEGRLSYKGYGETMPIADNDTEDGRALNRRVELRLVSR
jgi:OOP family OmpA-OmpF porin